MHRILASSIAPLFLVAAVATGCNGSLAVDASCSARGTPGCPCTTDGTCSPSADGVQVACVDGLCQIPDCPLGSEGCTCASGRQCRNDLICVDVQDALSCQKDCARGQPGCPCFSDGSCGEDEAGISLVCEQGSCQAASCDAGDEGCVCRAGGGCAEGLVCPSGRCAVDSGQTLSRPSDPKCYTPCRGGGLTRQVDGEDVYYACSDEGLIEGCIGDALCIDGSCVNPGASAARSLVAAVATCAQESDCPDYQSCIAGKCYSDCEADSDCRSVRACHRKVCRVPCTISDSSSSGDCPEDTYCETEDGTTGYCMPLVAGSSNPSEPDPGTYTLSTTAVELTSTAPDGSFEIINDTQTAQELTIRKRYHREFSSQGSTVVTDAPLHWLEIGTGESGPTSAEQEITVAVPAGEHLTVRIENGDNPEYDYWEGAIEVVHPSLGTQEVALSFSRLPEGQWAGQMYYLANFGVAGLDGWRANKGSDAAVRSVGNAFIRRWHALRQGRISFREFKAVVTATRDGTWQYAGTRQRCPSKAAPDPNVGCYLYDNNTGIAIYSDFLPDNPIPSGVTELPFAMNLQETDNPRAPGADPTRWSGRIVTEKALHYGGNPAVSVHFDVDPSTCEERHGDVCLTFLDGFNADIVVGGHYPTTPLDTGCAAAGDSFEQVQIPWLVPGFEEGTKLDSGRDLLMRYACRDKLFPYGADPQRVDDNMSYAAANPATNGTTLARHLKLVDGALINQNELFIIFEEQLPSPLSPQDSEVFSAYGFMVLTRSPVNLSSRDYQGSHPVDDRPPPAVAPVACSSDVLEQVLGGSNPTLDASNVDQVAQVVVNGLPTQALTVNPIDDVSPEKVHYYCEDTGYIDGGPRNTGGAGDVSIDCPPGSKVKFFTVQDDPNTTDVLEGSQVWAANLTCQTTQGYCRAGQPCTEPQDCSSPYVGTPGDNRDPTACVEAVEGCAVNTPCVYKGSCGDFINQLDAQAKTLGADDGDYGLPRLTPRNEAERLKYRPDPPWRCTDDGSAGSQYLIDCQSDRSDLRAERDFYPQVPNSKPTYRSLNNAVDQAFRYKTKFKNRQGKNIGFTPNICLPGSDLVPYCYDPPGIFEIRERVDCATHIYTDWYATLSVDTRALLKKYLQRNFANTHVLVPGESVPRTIDGFEHLNAELLVMLGDEAFTNASASRFDLAGQRVAPFPGDLFEPNGIRLSGGAGFEMYSLYQATEYYQLAIDRFYRLGSLLWKSLGGGTGGLPPGEGYITQATAASWFDRLIGASAHKARAWSEIAERYQSFNRPDLARLVVERAYTNAYMESTIFARLMQRLTETADAADVAQIVAQVEKAQLTYRRALQQMRNVYESISDDVTYFGFPPDYIPFPALSRSSTTNAFEEVLDRAWQRANVAAEKEEQALADKRNFETDSAVFQSELASLKREYDTQLMDLCGSFEASDPANPGSTRVVAAIPENASLDDRLAPQGNPCGRVGNGLIWEASGEVEKERLGFDAVKLAHRNLMAKIIGTEERAQADCQSSVDYAKWTLEQEQKKYVLGRIVDGMNLTIDTLDRFMGLLGGTTKIMRCNPLGADCAQAGAMATSFNVAGAVVGGIITGMKGEIIHLESEKEEISTAQLAEGILQGCDSVKINAQFVIKDLFREAEEVQLQAIKQSLTVDLAISKVERLQNQADSLIAAKDEALSHLINVEAAKNDPNIRIYTQDSVFAAERTFDRALVEAYKATKVFEYYTNQSYGALNDLFLVRMIQYGEPSLEAYLEELEDQYIVFQETYGVPDLRVAIVSLRDDVLGIPRVGNDNVGLTHDERVALFRAALTDPKLLDDRGYITASFPTTVEQVSPLTFNHKIRFIEAEIVGEENLGDELGRIYLTQEGTGVVRRADSDLAYYAFPERTAVIDTFFNGQRPLAAGLTGAEQVYGSDRLRDLPLVNTTWTLVINQKDEMVNRDIDLSSVDDVRLYIYYTDFTEL